MEGYIKIHRQILESPYFTDPETLKFWTWLLITASYKKRKVNLAVKNGSVVTVNLEPGDLIFGRLSASKTLKINESKLKRLLEKFLTDKSIVKKSTSNFSIISICNYASYQLDLDTDGQQPTSNRPATDQQPTTYKKDKKDKKDNNRNIDKDILSGIVEIVIEYLNKKTGKSFGTESKAAVRAISSRVNEGRVVDEFFAVVDVKVSQWLDDPKMFHYLRPETLFSEKFDSYLVESRSKVVEITHTKRQFVA